MINNVVLSSVRGQTHLKSCNQRQTVILRSLRIFAISARSASMETHE